MGSTVGWLGWYQGAHRRNTPFLSSGLVSAGLLFSLLWVAFGNTPTCVDEWWLFDQAGDLSALPWPAFLNQFVHSLHIDKQTPFLTFWLSRLPVLWVQQLLWFPWALLCAGLMLALYGPQAALLLATPVVALMIHQPSHDVLLFGTLLIVLRLRQLGYCIPAAVAYGLTYLMKPLTILTAPFILPQLGWYGLLSVGIWGGYVLWSLQYAFGRDQLNFLASQFLLTSWPRPLPGNSPGQEPLSLWEACLIFASAGFRRLRWRWNHLGWKAVQALPFYLFPTYLRRWTWRGIVLTIIIVLGYGNIKYLLLALLFVLPVQTDTAR